MDKAEFMARELAECETRWRQDEDVAAVAEAVALCGWNEWPLPEWTVGPICEGLHLFNNKGRRGGGTPATRHRVRLNDRHRHYLVEMVLQNPKLYAGKDAVTKEEAFEIVVGMLGRRRVSCRAIEESYRKLESTTKP